MIDKKSCSKTSNKQNNMSMAAGHSSPPEVRTSQITQSEVDELVYELQLELSRKSQPNNS